MHQSIREVRSRHFAQLPASASKILHSFDVPVKQLRQRPLSDLRLSPNRCGLGLENVAEWDKMQKPRARTDWSGCARSPARDPYKISGRCSPTATSKRTTPRQDMSRNFCKHTEIFRKETSSGAACLSARVSKSRSAYFGVSRKKAFSAGPEAA